MSDKNMEGGIVKKQMQNLISLEDDRQSQEVLKTFAYDAPGDYELLPLTKNHASKDSGMADVDIVTPDTQETVTLLNTSQNPKAEQQQTTNRLENTVDSLLDVRLEALKKSSTDRERFLNDSDSNRRSSDTNDSLTPFEYLDRAELMCCYVLYFCLLFVLVVFGIAYVWLPIIQGIVYDKHKNTTRLIDRQNYR